MMKKGLIATFILAVIAIVATGCLKYEDVAENGKNKTSSYYVKYKVYMPLYIGEYGAMPKRITVSTNEGQKEYEISSDEWEKSFGPFKKGETVTLKSEVIKGGMQNHTESYIQIFVRKDKEDYILKAEERKAGALSLSTKYTI